MKILHTLLAATLATLLIAASGVACDEHAEGESHEHSLALLLDGESETLTLDVDDLEVGETRQFFTEGGKEVVVTRTEDGYDLTVDGKEINIGGEGHYTMLHGDHDAKVMIKKLISGESHGYHFITGDGEDVEIDVDHDFHWVHGGEGDVKVMAFGAGDAAKRLEESGVLDNLPEEKRQAILDALGEAHGTHVEKRVMIIKKGDDADDSDDGGE